MDQQRVTLQEMGSQIELYKASGQQEAALRLQEQMTLIEQKFAEIQRKFQRFRCPNNLEPRLSRAMRELCGIEEATCLLELSSEDPEAVEGQLKHCLVRKAKRKICSRKIILYPYFVICSDFIKL